MEQGMYTKIGFSGIGTQRGPPRVFGNLQNKDWIMYAKISKTL